MEDEFDVASACAPTDDEFDVAPTVARRAQPRRRGCRKVVNTSLKNELAFVVTNGFSSSLSTVQELYAKSDRVGEALNSGIIAIIGVVIFSWAFDSFGTGDLVDDVVADMWDHYRRKCRRAKLIGGCLYTVHEFIPLDGTILKVASDDLINLAFAIPKWMQRLAERTFGGGTLLQLRKDFKCDAIPPTAFALSCQLAELVRDGQCHVLDIVPMGLKLCSGSFKPGFPMLSAARAWVRSMCKTTGTLRYKVKEPAADRRGALYDLPRATPEFQQSRVFGGGLRDAFDATRIVKALKFGRHLKDLGHSGEALVDALDLACADEVQRDEIVANMPKHPKRSVLHKSRIKLDAVTCNIDRRTFQDKIRTRSDELDSVHVYSDSSPVSGAELQGMVMDIVSITGEVVQYVLVGVMLHFGGTRLIDKALAFLWSLCLCIGTCFDDVSWFLSRVWSFTTDMGTEHRLGDTPDILRAFLNRLQGVSLEKCMNTIDKASRLMPNCIKVSGWSHVFGNLMKKFCTSFQRWPEFLSHIRACCKFFRISTYREHLVRTLGDSVCGKLLKHFTATIAKWRYETSYTVFSALTALRGLVQGHLLQIDEVMGPNVQDKKFIHDVKMAFGCSDLWTFMSVALEHGIERLEMGRRWGLVCKCCTALRRESGAHVRSKCGRASRRLKEARLFIIDRVADFHACGRDLWGNLGKCEGLAWLATAMSFALRSVGMEMKAKNSYLDKVPYLVAEAEDPAIAKLCAEQLRALADADLDPALSWMRHTLLGPLLADNMYTKLLILGVSSFIRTSFARVGNTWGGGHFRITVIAIATRF